MHKRKLETLLKPHRLHLERHRKFQIGITLGISAGTLVAMIVPEFSTHANLLILVANYFWVWEA